MKVSVKPQIKKLAPKAIPKKSSSVIEKVISSPQVTQKRKATVFSKVKQNAKRKSKIALKEMLLSRAFHVAFKVGLIAFMLSSVSYALYSHFDSSLENDVVVSKSEIVDRVSKLTTLPSGAPDAVVRVQDPEELKKQNEFYIDVKEGDYIIMYPKMAVIYDLRNNTIVSEKKTEK